VLQRLIGGLITAFSMYSVLPVPRRVWDEDNMRWALAFFPLVGAVIGGAVWLWVALCRFWQAGSLFCAAGMVLIPTAFSGGIHMDGLIDSCDALGSRGDRERKLEILKDSHVGAFGVMGFGAYLLVATAAAELWCRLERPLVPVMAGFVLSRALAALALVTMDCARGSGLAFLFAHSADRRTVRRAAAVYLVAVLSAMLWVSPAGGAVILCACALWFGFWRRLCRRHFGGLTGDLTGFWIQTCELTVLTTAALSARLPWFGQGLF
jgi:adenosylcobinamide-GDP ribazoletransferase